MKRLAHGPKETRAIGRELSLALRENSVIGLSGDLGAGKTEFVKGIAEGLGATDPVTSPTFTLVHEYRSGRLPLFHMDFYRLETEKELDEIKTITQQIMQMQVGQVGLIVRHCQIGA